MGEFDRYVDEERARQLAHRKDEKQRQRADAELRDQRRRLKLEASERARLLRPELHRALGALASVDVQRAMTAEGLPQAYYFSRSEGGWTSRIEPVLDDGWTRKRVRFRGWHGYVDVRPRSETNAGGRAVFDISRSGALTFTIAGRDGTFTTDSAVETGMLFWTHSEPYPYPTSTDVQLDLSDVLDDLLRLLAGYLTGLE